jgi:hypothetical protein
MADVKISGRVGGDLTITSTDNAADVTTFADKGATRLQFDGTAGNAYARIALDERLGRDNATAGSYSRTKRDNYLGYKFGGGTSAQFGRMQNAGKNVEKDPYITTFLETRSSIATPNAGGSNYASNSFVDHLVQVKMKAGAATVTVQYDLGDNSPSSPNPGHTGISVTGKAGPVNYWVAYNNGKADATVGNDQSNMKFGGSMKFGAIKGSINFTSSDDNGTEKDAILLMADMGLGNGVSANFSYATLDAAEDATWMRLAVTKKLSKGVKVFGGYTATDYDGATADFTKIGAGMIVKF